MTVSSICACVGQLFWKLAMERGMLFMLSGFLFYGIGALIMLTAYRFGQLSVLQTEALVKVLQREKRDKPAGDELALYLGELEKDLSGRLGRKVHIAHHGKKGRIELEYYDSQDLEGLLALLQGLPGGEVGRHG